MYVTTEPLFARFLAAPKIRLDSQNESGFDIVTIWTDKEDRPLSYP